jgi:hypothetical protein
MSITVLMSLMIIPLGMSQSAEEIEKKALENMSFSSMEMKATLKIYDSKGRERVRQINTISGEFGDAEKTVIRFTSPPDIKGTAMLIHDYDSKDDDMWIYLPALRKTRRIVSNEKSKSFMGSEFSNADMSKPNSGDFTHKILGTEEYQSNTCWKIESRCKDEDKEDMYGYSRKVTWITKDKYLSLKIAYYDYNDDLLKVQTLKEYKKQSNGKYFAYKMEVVNKQNQRKSTMTINEFKLGSTKPESYFSSSTLNQ